MPALAGRSRPQRTRTGDPRDVQGQRLLVEAIKYLVRSDPLGNVSAVKLLSKHFLTKLRGTDRPGELHPQA